VKTSLKALFAQEEVKTAPAVIVRRAGPEDFPAIARLLVTAHWHYQWSMPPDAYLMFVTGLVDIETLCGSAEILVAERDGGVIGTASYQRQGGAPWPGRWAPIRPLAVDPQDHRQGVGGALLDACVRCALVDHAAALGVHTAPFMSSAIQIYENRGFWRIPRCDADLTRSLGLPSPVPVPVLAYALPLD
jgi:GNAT superfamily N-acetyltransferase